MTVEGINIYEMSDFKCSGTITPPYIMNALSCLTHFNNNATCQLLLPMRLRVIRWEKPILASLVII